MHGYHGLHFEHVSGWDTRVSVVGPMLLFIFQDFSIFLEVPLLPCPPPFKEPLNHIHCCLLTRRLFTRCTFMSGEAVHLCWFWPTYLILRKLEPCSIFEMVLIFYVPWGPVFLCSTRRAPLVLVLLEADPCVILIVMLESLFVPEMSLEALSSLWNVDSIFTQPTLSLVT